MSKTTHTPFAIEIILSELETSVGDCDSRLAAADLVRETSAQIEQWFEEEAEKEA